MYERGGFPAHVSEALKQRENDPERLKVALRYALCTARSHTSPLAKVLAEHIGGAIESEDVKTMKKAKQLFEESEGAIAAQDEIPF